MICSWQKPLKGNSIGVVFGSFAPLHQGHLDVIMRAKKENDGGCIVIVCGRDGDKGEPLMPHNKRYRYVREFFADDDLVAVYGINETEIGAAEYPNGWGKWLEEFENIYLQKFYDLYMSLLDFKGCNDFTQLIMVELLDGKLKLHEFKY
jgi:cytidyltransferase-like protein